MRIDRVCLQQNATQMLRGNTVPSPWGNLPNALAEEVKRGLNNFRVRKTIQTFNYCCFNFP